MAAGKWEKSKFVGSELAGKTLGIVGLGQVGSRVASRARAFEARVLGHDPYLPAGESAGDGRAARVPRRAPRCVGHRHAPRDGDGGPRPLLGPDELAQMKPGAVLVNVARGSLVDRAALYEALESGRLAGAALDVFDPEPPDPADPLLKLPNVVATPHLGASTRRGAGARLAPDRGGRGRGARRRVLRPGGEPAVPRPQGRGGRGGLDAPRRAHGALPLAALGGRLRRSRSRRGGCPRTLRPVAVAAVKGALQTHSPETVNYVNALFVARERGLAVAETRHEEPGNYARSIRVTLVGGGGQAAPWGRSFGAGRPGRRGGRPAARIPSRGNGRLLRNRDVPGVVGRVGTILGEAAINIADFSLARGEGDRAAAIIAVDSVPPSDVLATLREGAGVEEVRVVTGEPEASRGPLRRKVGRAGSLRGSRREPSSRRSTGRSTT